MKNAKRGAFTVSGKREMISTLNLINKCDLATKIQYDPNSRCINQALSLLF